MMKSRLNTMLVMLLLCVLSTGARAESSILVGDYVVHYNALSTESLPAAVAKAYGIKRSQNRGLLSIAVLKKGEGYIAATADITATATNLAGQLKTLDLRQVNEQNAIYYLSDFSVANQETLNFKIYVKTADNASANIELRQQFFAE